MALNQTSPRILIVRLSALGDVVHALPVLAAVRGAWPGAFVGWLCEPGGAALLKGHPMIDALHVVPKGVLRQSVSKPGGGLVKQMSEELRAQAYEVSIDVQGLTKSAVWPWFARIPRRIGFKGAEAREISPLLYTERVRPPAECLHVVRRNLCLLEPLGIAQPKQPQFPVHLPADALARAEALVPEAATGNGPIVISPGAGWATKIWPPERFGQLARRLAERFGRRVLVAWGPAEIDLARAVLEAAGASSPANWEASIPGSAPGVYALSPTSFAGLGAVLSRAALFVGGDTGPTHLAAALGVPTVSMMGPLDARRNGPFGAHCVTIQHAVPRKAPPWRNHRRWCDPLTDLRGVTVDEVREACEKMLALAGQYASI